MAVVSDTYIGSTHIIIHDDYYLASDALALSVKRVEQLAARCEITRQISEQAKDVAN